MDKLNVIYQVLVILAVVGLNNTTLGNSASPRVTLNHSYQPSIRPKVEVTLPLPSSGHIIIENPNDITYRICIISDFGILSYHTIAENSTVTIPYQQAEKTLKIKFLSPPQRDVIIQELGK